MLVSALTRHVARRNINKGMLFLVNNIFFN